MRDRVLIRHVVSPRPTNPRRRLDKGEVSYASYIVGFATEREEWTFAEFIRLPEAELAPCESELT